MEGVFLSSVSPAEALERLFKKAGQLFLILGHETINITESLGRITATPVFARYSSPFFHSAAMDGFAVRFEDTFTASEKTPCLLNLGKDAVYVDTGDPMPEGFNAVVMVEEVNKTGDYIEIYASVTPYQHVRPIGEDIVATELIIPENHRIRPIDMGAMLASGHIKVSVRKKPKMAIIPTGTEMIEPEIVRQRPPRPPEIIEYNSVVLAALAAENSTDITKYPIVRDDKEELKQVISKAVSGHDIVMVNAGSGKGSEDFTAAAIEELGELLVHSVAIKPGKPVIIGIVDKKPVFGIPGYPVSAYIAFDLFVKPLLAKLTNISMKSNETISSVLSRQIASSLGVDEFVRVKVGIVGDKAIATPVGRGAGLLMSLVRADGILKIPASSEGITGGTLVEVDLLRSSNEIANTIVCIGSHDNTLDVLANIIKKNHPGFSLSSAHVGSMGGLMALKRAEAHFAGTHLLDEESGEYNVSYVKKILAGRKTLLVNLVYRQQGLLVKRGNPKAIKGFEDLVRDDVSFINRQQGSGTRLLLDKHLRERGIDLRQIKGYDRDEYTHMAVASAVLTGLADTGLAIDSSAKALGLDFIPVANERYDLAIPCDLVETEKIQILLGIIRDNQEFKRIIESLGGYDTRDMGRILYEG